MKMIGWTTSVILADVEFQKVWPNAETPYFR